jgi:hypothetical protein
MDQVFGRECTKLPTEQVLGDLHGHDLDEIVKLVDGQTVLSLDIDQELTFLLSTNVSLHVLHEHFGVV